MIHSIPIRDLHETWLTSIQEDLKVMQLLFDISQVLNKSLSLEESLQSVLGKMAEQAGMKEGSVTILNRETGGTEFNLAYGLSREERSKHRVREEITDRVVETGIPAIVEGFSQKPGSLNGRQILDKEIGQRMEDRISYICVPIHGRDGIIGVIGADRLFPGKKSTEEDVRLLTGIAGVLADAIESRSEAQKQQHILQEKLDRLQSEFVDQFKPVKIIGNSHAIQKVHQLINQVSSSRSNVLVTGEVGTGKELVARAIHANSPRAEKPFIAVNLTALPQDAIGRELFGSGPDKFINAKSKGCFEMANGGTLFLDEIGHLPMAIQTGLLHVLQEGESPGSNLGMDVRIISATSHNLETSVRNSEFRLDLFYRLNVFPIFVPPLRERKTDIVLLTDHFIEGAAQRRSKPVHRISAHSIDLMMSHHWPGNVRELENCIERAVFLSTDGVIHAHHLPPSIRTSEPCVKPLHGNLQAWLAVLEQDLIVDALKSALGNTARAASFLGVDALLMSRRIKKYGIDLKRFKPPGNGVDHS
jgi:Nif-specific regulatory protein